jgi:hypothetical protein
MLLFSSYLSNSDEDLEQSPQKFTEEQPFCDLELEDEEDDLIIDTRGKQNPLLQAQVDAKPIKEKSEKQ